MNILFDIGHPAHVHLFKHTIRSLQHNGHTVYIICRRQAIVQQLLQQEGFDYIVIGNKHNSLFGKGLMVAVLTLKVWWFVLRHRIDIGVSSGVVLSLVSRLCRMKAIVMDDDDDDVEPLAVRWGHRYAHAVLTPNCIHRQTAHAVYYASIHELAYLHPNQFTPQRNILEHLALHDNEPFFVVRFVAFHGHHDLHEQGLTLQQKERLVTLLSRHGRVIITSESPLPPSLESYRACLPAGRQNQMHHLLAFATLYVGDSQTMTSEAAVLGTLSIKCNTFSGRLSVPNLLEHYGLCQSFTPDRFEEMCHHIETLLGDPSIKNTYAERRKKFLADHIDTSSYLTHFLEHLPAGRQAAPIDFTLEQYQALLKALTSSGIDYTLRHDIDAHPERAIRLSKIEHLMGIRAIYYFRRQPAGRWDEQAIRTIAAMGHTIGYHYETLSDCKGDMVAAYDNFCRDLDELRQLAEVHTISMHGSPRSRYDNRDLWKHYDYHTLDIDNEPYLDTDFNHTLYLTDTGGRWDGWRYSIRDTIDNHQQQWERQGLVFHHTNDIINALRDSHHPIHHRQLQLNIHPQRWMPFGIQWCTETLWQKIKNQIKRLYK